jgi:hypothetical protein
LRREQVQSYLLTLQVRNAPDLVAEAQLNIKVKDENNKSPVFTNIDSGQNRQTDRGSVAAHPGCLSRIRMLSIPDPVCEFFPSPIPDTHQII